MLSQLILLSFSFFLYAFVIYLSIFSHYFSVPVGFFGYILTNIRSKGAAPDHITVIRFASTDFRIKTADETLIDRSDIGHYNFAESLCTLSISIQNMNAHDVSTDYFEGANLRPI